MLSRRDEATFSVASLRNEMIDVGSIYGVRERDLTGTGVAAHGVSSPNTEE